MLIIEVFVLDSFVLLSINVWLGCVCLGHIQVNDTPIFYLGKIERLTFTAQLLPT